ncbi:Dual specificity phosphatase Cdc25B [Hyphodiscus hymeniophilus]|uniref:Dual specificity phosphatase Cdc25B n=1 Tax=Hyphodiscus hymeniophilus TaxID=353542 RepID=A0A9P7AZY3_9HELO|nr:Dual specificity phosphatase Cdc25B [Hyphodiscus hymeniophilus]
MAEPQATQATQTDQWWSAFPAPKAKVSEISSSEVMQLFDDMDIKPEPRSFLLVDVRRNDWEGGTVKTSLNLPAQSFYQSRKTLLDLCDRASITQVIFYCGSSSGRGPRCAGWMQDYINDVSKFGRKSALQVLVLKGGIKGWVKDFGGSMVDGFEEKYWEQFR